MAIRCWVNRVVRLARPPLDTGSRGLDEVGEEQPQHKLLHDLRDTRIEFGLLSQLGT
jgi:hypothetical protein